jgi:hypothetical protein
MSILKNHGYIFVFITKYFHKGIFERAIDFPLVVAAIMRAELASGMQKPGHGECLAIWMFKRIC